MSHYYNDSSGKSIASVTTKIDKVFGAKSTWLIPWSAKVERLALLDLWWDSYQGLTQFDSKEHLIQFAAPYFHQYKKVSGKAKDLGSYIHGLIEFYYKHFDYRADNFTHDELYRFWLSECVDSDKVKMVSAFFRCLKNENIEVINSEQTVIKDGIAGTRDLLAKVNGVLSIGDIKTGKPNKKKSANPDHRIQVEGYRRATDPDKVRGKFIIYLSKETPGEYDYWYTDDETEHLRDWQAYKAIETLYDYLTKEG